MLNGVGNGKILLDFEAIFSFLIFLQLNKIPKRLCHAYNFQTVTVNLLKLGVNCKQIQSLLVSSATLFKDPTAQEKYPNSPWK